MIYYISTITAQVLRPVSAPALTLVLPFFLGSSYPCDTFQLIAHFINLYGIGLDSSLGHVQTNWVCS
jgi:hypothetical protein